MNNFRIMTEILGMQIDVCEKPRLGRKLVDQLQNLNLKYIFETIFSG